ncbi:hypothetical protein M0805_007953 [Coniferiporia weirii]|nr:hypothetical protein M0805_007953 [Coniferiporia weirii]
MSDELAQEDEDAEDYDLEAIEARTQAREEDDDDTVIVNSCGEHAPIVGEDDVVFEIGDQDLSDDEEPRSADRRHREDSRRVSDVERQGLVSGGSRRDRTD